MPSPARESADDRRTARRAALDRIEALNPRLNAVIAVDPTALDQARALDRDPPRARAAVRHADPDQGQYRDRRAAADHRRQPRAGEQRHQPRRAAGRAAARRRRGDRRQGQSVANGRTSARPIRSRAGARSAARSATPCARTATPAARARAAARRSPAGMVPAAIGTETDGSITCPAAINGIVGFKPTRRPGQPHPCRADQPQPGHARADDAAPCATPP